MELTKKSSVHYFCYCLGEKVSDYFEFDSSPIFQARISAVEFNSYDIYIQVYNATHTM